MEFGDFGILKFFRIFPEFGSLCSSNFWSSIYLRKCTMNGLYANHSANLINGDFNEARHEYRTLTLFLYFTFCYAYNVQKELFIALCTVGYYGNFKDILVYFTVCK